MTVWGELSKLEYTQWRQSWLMMWGMVGFMVTQDFIRNVGCGQSLDNRAWIRNFELTGEVSV